MTFTHTFVPAGTPPNSQTVAVGADVRRVVEALAVAAFVLHDELMGGCGCARRLEPGEQGEGYEHGNDAPHGAPPSPCGMTAAIVRMLVRARIGDLEAPR